MPVIREVHEAGQCVRLDLTRQVLRLEVPEVFSHRRPGERDHADPPLLDILPHKTNGPVSAATLLLKARQFDDGLYAAVELAAQQGAGRFAGKAALLRSLAGMLAAEPATTEPSAAVLLHAACQLGGIAAATPACWQVAVHKTIEEFFSDELQSQPLGFYTWSNELKAIFCQDRLLQRPMERIAETALARALDSTPGAREAHDAYLHLTSRLTNPPKKLNLQDAGKRPPFFPPSRSHEVELFESLYENQAIPEGFDLMTELIRRVRVGEIDLKPTDSSGWYDHQTWSLEPLLLPDRMPESARLELGQRYRRHLEDLFRGVLTLVRETHVKQEGGGRGGYGGGGYGRPSPISVHPSLTVEPLASLYSRRANCYRFVRAVLEQAFGTDALRHLHRFSQRGASEVNLAEELEWIQRLFEGAAATANQQLGHEARAESEEQIRTFAQWREKLAIDPDVSSDVRMMVPVFQDLQRQKTKVLDLPGVADGVG